MGQCSAQEMKNREDQREITFATEAKITCKQSIITSKQEQIELKKNKNENMQRYDQKKQQHEINQESINKPNIAQKKLYICEQSVKQIQILEEDEEDNPKRLVRQLCKEDIIINTNEEEQIQNNQYGSSLSSINNLNQVNSTQSTRNNTQSCSVISGNTQISIPFSSSLIARSQSTNSLPPTGCTPQVRINNNSFSSIPSNQQQNQSTSICINGIAQRRNSLLFRQKSQSPSKQRKNSSSRRTSMTTIDVSRSPSHNYYISDNTSSNYYIQPSTCSIEDILTLINNKNSDVASIQELCDAYVERKRLEYFNEYTSDEFYNAIQDLAVVLFRSQLQDLGKHYLDQLVHHKKVNTQKNLLKNLLEYQKKL